MGLSSSTGENRAWDCETGLGVRDTVGTWGNRAMGRCRCWNGDSVSVSSRGAPLCHRCFRNVASPPRPWSVPTEPWHPEKKWAGSGPRSQERRRSSPPQLPATACPGWWVGWVGGTRVGAGWEDGHALQLHLPSLHSQVWELRERLDRVRGFWAGLPLAVCGDSRMALDITQEAAPCWTGTGRGR